jgi:8-oxo-dGTP pyrophosphatase MutT (NUDIX family)
MACPDELRRLLEAYRPADARESEHCARLVQLLTATSQPFSRAQYAPGHVTASAFVADPAFAQVLLVFHGKLLRWLQPGGHVELDDRDVLESARREVREEVGVNDLAAVGGVFDVDVHEIPARGEQPAHEHFDVRFLFTTEQREFAAGDDALDARWVPVAELLHERRPGEELPYPSDESVLRALRKLPRVRA